MFKKLLKNNLAKTITLALILSIFIILVFSLNYNLILSDEALNAYNNLPFWLQSIFMIMLPIFGNFNYLYQFIMIYMIPILFIYSFYLGNKVNDENQIEETMPIKQNKKKLYYFLAPLIHILALNLILMLITIITSSSLYKCFYLEVINGFVSLLFWNLVIYAFALIFKNIKKKNKYIIISLTLIYLILGLILTGILKLDWFYYLSPLNILLYPINSFLIYLIPLGLILTIFIIYLSKRYKK